MSAKPVRVLYDEVPEDESTITSYLRDLNQDGYLLLKEEDKETVMSRVPSRPHSKGPRSSPEVHTANIEEL